VEKREVLTAVELMQRFPPWVDVDCPAWGGQVRIARLEGPAKLRLAIEVEGLQRGEDGKLSLLDPRNWEFAVRLLAASIVDAAGTVQFSDPSAQVWLSGEISAVGQLLSVAIRVQGLQDDTVAADVAAAKKN
jgi:hypothetical protein